MPTASKSHAFRLSDLARLDLDLPQTPAVTEVMPFLKLGGTTHGIALMAREAMRTATQISRQHTTRRSCTKKVGFTDLALESDHMCCSAARRPSQSRTPFSTARHQTSRTLVLPVIHTAAMQATEAATINGRVTKIVHLRASPRFGLASRPIEVDLWLYDYVAFTTIMCTYRHRCAIVKEVC